MNLRFFTFFISLIVGTIAFSHTASAQSQLSPGLKDQINDVIGDAVNGVTIFTSQPTVSTGSFRIHNDDEPDSHFDVFRIPMSIDLTKNGMFTPFVEGDLGFFKLVETFYPVQGGGTNDFSSIKTLSAGGGGGVRIEPVAGFSFAPAFSAYYSHTENQYDYNNQFSQQVLEPFGKQLFNWDVDTMTYVPSIRADLTLPVSYSKLLFWSKYSHLFNDSVSTNSSTIDINSNTGLWQNSIGWQFPTGLELADAPLAVKTTLTRTDIYGSGSNGLDVSDFYEVGIDLLADAKANSSSVLSRLSLGGSYSFGDNLDGWRVGVGYGF